MLGILVEFVEFLFIFCILNNHYSRKKHNSLNSFTSADRVRTL